MSASKVLGIFCLALILLLTATGTGFAQDGQPPKAPDVPVTPHFPPNKFPIDGGQFGMGSPVFARTASNVSAQALTLGAPGLSFRYVQTFGVTSEPYLADGAHLNGPNGLFIDSSDTLFVTEEIGHRVLAYNSAGANTMILGHAGQPWHHDDFLSTPKDIAKDGSGNIWIVYGGSAIKEFDSTGNLVQMYPAIDPWQGGDTNDRFNDPRGIAFDAAGLMYISDANNHRIQIYDVSGATPSYISTIGVTGVPQSDNTGFNYPGQIAFDSSGKLYVVDTNNYRVQRCTFGVDWTCTTFFGVTGVPGSDLTHLDWANGITINGSNIFIADSANHRVFKCTTSAVCTLFAGTGVSGANNSQFNVPDDVAVDSSGNIFVSDFHNHRVQKFNSVGVYQSTIGVTGVPYLTDNSHFNSPWGIALAPDNSIYILERMGYRLIKLNSSGIFQWSAGEAGVYGSDNAHLGSWWAGVEGSPAIDANGHIYIGDTGNDRVQIFNSDGSYYTTLGSSGTGNYEFSCPTGVAINPVSGDIYVTDHCNHRIQVFTSSLVYKATLGATGATGSDNLHFTYPWGVTVDNSGNIFVADSDNYRVQKCQLISGAPGYVCSTFAGETGVSNVDFAHLGYPTAVKVDTTGRVYVVDDGNSRVQVFDASGAYLTTIGGNWGASNGSLIGPSGVALDSSGNVYVTDRDNHRIQKFTPGVPGWQQKNINGFGNINNNAVNRMSVFNGYMYAGTANDYGAGGQVWRSADGSNWSQVNVDGFGDVNNMYAQLGKSFNGNMYVGTLNPVTGGEIWRCTVCDGSDWTQVVSGGFGDVNNTTVEQIVILSNTLYATVNNFITGAEVWKSSTGNPGSWIQVNTDGFGDVKNTGLWAATVFNDYLYVATSQWGDPWNTDTYTGGEVWRTNDGVTWSQVNVDGFGERDNMGHWLESFDGYLYALTWNYGTGTQMWRCSTCDGSDWTRVVGDGFGDSNNFAGSYMLSFGGRFYVGTHNEFTGTEIWRTTNGTNWTQVNIDGHGDSNNIDTRSGAVFNGGLFFSTLNWANGTEVWAMLPTTLPSPWVGGVSISSDKNVVSVGRPHIGSEIASYDGFSTAGAHIAYIPMLFRGAYGGTYNAAFYIQNVDAGTANIDINYYDSTGALTCHTLDTITTQASKGYWLPGTCVPANWVGGAVVTSDQNIVAIGRPHIGAEVMTYNSFSSGSLTSYIPMLFRAAYGGTYNAAFYVQNVGAASANLTIKYYDSTGALTCTATDTLSALASKGYWLPGTCVPANWVGGAVVTSTQPIVSVGRPHIGTQITTYNGFSAGSGTSYVPMLFRGAFGGTYNAAFYVQNLSGSAANVTIKYYDLAGALTCTATDTLSALASKGYWLPGTCVPNNWVGGAVVTSNQDIVTVGRPHIGAQVTTYDGFTSGSLASYLPMLFKAAYGGTYSAAYYIQNTEATAATVTTKFYDSTGALTCSRSDTLAPFSTLSLWAPSLTCVP